MKTVDKAMLLLRQFSLEDLEIGLNELARRTGQDKAVTHRLLQSLAKHGFVEQNPESRKYFLGHGFLSLSRLREATVPMIKATQIVTKWLSAKSNETAHIGIPGAESMLTVAYALPARGNVINLRPADSYPYHASSSGLAFLSFCSDPTRVRLLDLKRTRLTRHTLVAESALLDFFEETRRRGYSFSRNGVEEGVCSVAMPFFTDGEDPAGTVSIALPDGTMTPERLAELSGWIGAAVEQLEIALTGELISRRRLKDQGA